LVVLLNSLDDGRHLHKVRARARYDDYFHFMSPSDVS
jgi:hypothetical protein